jgi:rare lipoprotein A
MMPRLGVLRGVLLAGLLAAGPAVAPAAPGGLRRVTAGRADLRAGPSETADVRGRIEAGEQRLEPEREDDWHNVRIMRTGEEGWIAGRLVEPVASGEPGRSRAGGTGSGDDGTLVFREEGRATVYGDELQGRRTASGQRLDQDKPVAAHPALPLGSKATVVNPDTGKRAEVEVVDRGPHAEGLDVDLSKRAVEAIGLAEEVREKGRAEVRIEATEGQGEKAIDTPEEADQVEGQLRKAREEAARKGTLQPEVTLDLESPQEEAAGGR